MKKTKKSRVWMNTIDKLSPTQIAASLVRQVSYERPEGYFTTAEYAKDNGVSRASALQAVRRLHDSGHISPVRFKIRRSDGQWQIVGGWRLEEKGREKNAKISTSFSTPYSPDPILDKPTRKR